MTGDTIINAANDDDDNEYAVEIPQQQSSDNNNNNNNAEEGEEVAAAAIIHTNLLLYRFFPIGSYRIAFDNSNNSVANISGGATRCCCCCCYWCPTQSHEVSLQNIVRLQIRQETIACCNVGRFLRDFGLSFILAFLFHLIPSIIWGAEQSLGSPSNHQLMGAVWFGGWPIWFLLLQFLRPWGIEFTTQQDDGKDNDKDNVNTHIFVPFNSWNHAVEVKAWFEKQQQQQQQSNKNNNQQRAPLPEKPQLLNDYQFLIGWLVFLGLLANMIITGALVTQCNDRGCCKDDEATLDCCVETGYPEC